MLSLVLPAVRARRVQSLALAAIALLAALGCASAPWFATRGRDAAARADIAAAPETDTVVTVSGTVAYAAAGADPMRLLAQRVAADLGPMTGPVRVDGRTLVSVGPAGTGSGGPTSTSIDLYLAARDGVCAEVSVVAGRCADAVGEVMLAAAVAGGLGVGPGDPVVVSGQRFAAPIRLTLSGTYDIIDSGATFWTGTGLLDQVTQPAFISSAGLLALAPDHLVLDAQAGLLPAAVTDARLPGVLAAASADLRHDQLELRSAVGPLLDRVAHDRQLVLLGVLVGAGQVLLVSWVALYLACRHAAQVRRPDLAVLKLRGVGPARVWLLVALSNALPMLAGTLAGVVGGRLAAIALGGSELGGLGLGGSGLGGSGGGWVVAGFSVAAAALAGLGGVLIAVVAEWRSVRAPVAELLRRVPRERGWRGDVADLVVVVLAAAGVYQARAGGDDSPLSLLAPALVALAVAMLTARLLPVAAARWGAAALRAGRLGGALAALSLARRPGARRVFAVLVVAAAIFSGTAIAWARASTAWGEQATQELGADRVLTVTAANPQALLAAVAAADPTGRFAMAVVTLPGREPVVAVDATRLATVGRAVAGQPGPAELAARLRPGGGQAPTVGDGPLTLDATEAPGVGLRVELSTVDGKSRVVEFAPGQVTASVSGCEPTCRLVSIAPTTGPAAVLSGSADGTVPVIQLRSLAPLLDPAELGDIAAWRTTDLSDQLPPLLGAHDGELTISLPAGRATDGVTLDPRVFPLTTPVPVPAVRAGAAGPVGDAQVGDTGVPATVVAQVPAVPGLAGGQGLLVDLESMMDSADGGELTGTFAVWLTADAPDTIGPALIEHGVSVLGQDSVAARAATLAGFGPGLALRFELFTAVVLLLLAAGVGVLGAAVGRDARAGELAALRAQGLSARSARVAATAGSLAMVIAAAVVGVLVGLGRR